MKKFEEAKSERTLLKHLTAYDTAQGEAGPVDGNGLMREPLSVSGIARTSCVSSMCVQVNFVERPMSSPKWRRFSRYSSRKLPRRRSGKAPGIFKSILTRYYAISMMWRRRRRSWRRSFLDTAVCQEPSLSSVCLPATVLRVASGTRKRWVGGSMDTSGSRSLRSRIGTSDYEQWSQRGGADPGCHHSFLIGGRKIRMEGFGVFLIPPEGRYPKRG